MTGYRGMRHRWPGILLLSGLILHLTSCAPGRPPMPAGPPSATATAGTASHLVLRPAGFADLPGWRGDDAQGALAAFRVTCHTLSARQPAESDDFGTGADWQPACDAAARVPAGDGVAAKSFFERFFLPFQASDSATDDANGLFTGYYQPLLHGARQPGGRYTVPLYRRPSDLVSVDLGQFRPELKGRRIAGRLSGAKLLPYASRAAIEQGALAGKGLELVWVDDAADAFFLGVQGSGRIQMADGSLMPVVYDGDNGRAYVSIGKVLAGQGVPVDQITLPFLRQWLRHHPAEAAGLMDRNPAYVFFKPLTGTGAAVGASGAGLTPGRSVAVDPAFIPYGVPAWIDAEDAAEPGGRFEHLVVAQDTGSAIRGVVRADIFLGSDEAAGVHAGQLKGRGRWWLLLPRALAARLP